MRASVITTIYRLHNDFQRLLRSIYRQRAQHNEMLVIAGYTDQEGLELAKAWRIEISVLQVLQGQKANITRAVNWALSVSRGDHYRPP